MTRLLKLPSRKNDHHSLQVSNQLRN